MITATVNARNHRGTAGGGVFCFVRAEAIKGEHIGESSTSGKSSTQHGTLTYYTYMFTPEPEFIFLSLFRIDFVPESILDFFIILLCSSLNVKNIQPTRTIILHGLILGYSQASDR